MVNLTLPGTLLCFLFATVMCGKVDTGTRRYLLGSSSESARPHSQSEKAEIPAIPLNRTSLLLSRTLQGLQTNLKSPPKYPLFILQVQLFWLW